MSVSDGSVYDIIESMEILRNQDIMPNHAELGKTYGCDYQTVKRYFEQDDEAKRNGSRGRRYLTGFGRRSR